jgi:transcriptional regulator NrdR family protein
MPAIQVQCPSCTSRQTYIVMTNQLDDGTIVRRRHCRACDHRWYTQQPAEVQVPRCLLQWSNKKYIIAIRNNDPL